VSPTDAIRLYGKGDHGVADPVEVARWLHRLYETSFNHGAVLATAIGNYPAEQILKSLESAGWIKRCDKPTPTQSQRFFGMGGMWMDHLLRSPDAVAFHPTIFGFNAVYCDGLKEWILANPTP
jgi:hypothetical protein